MSAEPATSETAGAATPAPAAPHPNSKAAKKEIRKADKVAQRAMPGDPNHPSSKAAAAPQADAKADYLAKAEQAKLSPRPAMIRKFLDTDLQLAEFVRPAFRILVRDEKMTVEDILKPECWCNLGEKIKGNAQHPFAIIELVWEDASRYVELIVIDSGPQWAKVRVLRDIDLTGSLDDVQKIREGAQDARFAVEWKGPSVQWCITRVSDGNRLSTNHTDKTAAQKWLAEYIKAQG